MSLAQFLGYTRAHRRLDRAALLDAALAARVAQADDKNWKRFHRDMTRGD